MFRWRKDVLVLENGYNSTYAPRFLSVYDETIAFAGLSDSDKIEITNDENGSSFEGEKNNVFQRNEGNSPEKFPPSTSKGFALMAGERVLQDGILSQNATYRIIVNGKVGPKEIDRLIKKLEVDKEILAEPEEGSVDKLTN